MGKYKCIKAFSIPRADKDGYADEEHSYYIRKGSMWELPNEEDRYNILDGEIELQKASSNGDYIVITKKLLKEYFIEVQNGI